MNLLLIRDSYNVLDTSTGFLIRNGGLHEWSYYYMSGIAVQYWMNVLASMFNQNRTMYAKRSL
jgi:hypothetical protein